MWYWVSFPWWLMMLNTFFTYLLAICISSSEKYLFKSFAHFLIRLFVSLLLNYRSSNRYWKLHLTWDFPGGISDKESACNAGDLRDMGSIPGLGRAPGGGHGNPLPYFCLENPMDRGTWWDTVYRFAKSQTQLKWLSMHAHLSKNGAFGRNSQFLGVREQS